jgi:hypothetical protein
VDRGRVLDGVALTGVHDRRVLGVALARLNGVDGRPALGLRTALTTVAPWAASIPLVVAEADARDRTPRELQRRPPTPHELQRRPNGRDEPSLT